MRSLLIILLATPLASAQAPAPKVETNEPVRLSFAGIQLGLPKGFSLRQSDAANLVVHARKMAGDTPVVGLKLIAWGLAKGTGTADFIKAVHPRGIRAFTELKVLREKGIRLGDAVGSVQIMDYKYRGNAQRAVWMFLLRDVAGGDHKMGYALLLETDPKRAAEVMPALIAVAKTIKLFDPAPPVEQEITALGEPIASKALRYSLRPPLWWKAMVAKDRTVITMFQSDYAKGKRMPLATLEVLPEQRNASECVAQAMADLKKKNINPSSTIKILRQGPVKMAGRDGYEVLLRHEEPYLTRMRMALIGRRTVCAGGRSYTLVVVLDVDKPDAAKAMLDAIAAGLVIDGPPEATTRPAPTTQPAKTAGN